MAYGLWTDEENDLIVADYFAMLADDISARRYSKAEHRRALLPLLHDRSEGSVGFKHQNIIAVLKIMTVAKLGVLLAAVAGGVVMSASAFAQSAAPGTCQIFEHIDDGGLGGTIVGSQPSGDAVLFVNQDKAPSDMVAFLGGTMKYRLFYDRTWREIVSSVKVGPGCILELHNRLQMHQGSTFPFVSYTADTPWIGDEQNDKAKIAICRCPS